MSQFDPKDYWEHRLRKDFGLHGVGYIGLGRPYNDWLYRVRKAVFRRLARDIEVDFPTARVLDLGSGTGFYIERWKELGVGRVSGADLTEVAVEHLRSRFPQDEFFRLDITSGGPFPGAPYDIISAFDVLFHIVDDTRYREALAGISGSLRPGGCFVFSENFLSGETVRSAHIVSRSAQEIERDLASAGLTILRRGPMFALMNYPVDTRSRLPQHLWSAMTLPLRAHRGLGRFTGYLLGAILYLPERLLVATLREGPSTKYAICRKAH